MTHVQDIDLSPVLQGRMATYQFLSRLFRTEVDQELYDTLVAMRFPANTGNDLVDEGYRMICTYLSQADGTVLTELAVDFVRAFIGSGNDGYSAAYPFESVYTSPKRLMMQDARDEVLVLYHAAGLDKQEDWKEGEDHIALELEFEQILAERALKAYEAGDEDACAQHLLQQKNFLEDHLLAWYPMMADDMQKFPRTDFYRGLGKLTSGFLQNDLEFLDDVLSGSDEGEKAVGADAADLDAASVAQADAPDAADVAQVDAPGAAGVVQADALDAAGVAQVDVPDAADAYRSDASGSPEEKSLVEGIA